MYIKIETYLLGTIIEIKEKNLLLLDEDSEKNISILINEEQKSELLHLLAKKIIVRTKAEQDTNTNKIKNYELLDFRIYKPSLLPKQTTETTNAWKNVKNAAAWVRKLRGNDI